MTQEALKLAFEAFQYVVTPSGGTRAYVWDSNEARLVADAYRALEKALAQPEQEPVAWATREDFYRELDRTVNRMRQQMEIKGVVMRCADYDIALPVIDIREGHVLVGQVATPPQPEQEHFALKHRIAELEGAVIGLQAQLAQTERPVDCERCNRLEEQAYDLVGKLRVANIKLFMQPQRTWVGLTDEEILKILGIHLEMDDDIEDWRYEINEARAIEAKLKEKNT